MGAPVQAFPAVGVATYKNIRYDVLYAAVNASSSGDNTLVAAVAGKSIVAMFFIFERSDAVTFHVKSSGGTILHGPCGPSVVGGGQAPAFNPVGWFKTAPGEALVMNLSAPIQVGGVLGYIVV